jgi:hypothetical protein
MLDEFRWHAFRIIQIVRGYAEKTWLIFITAQNLITNDIIVVGSASDLIPQNQKHAYKR